jgi:hypothetical protein
MEDFSGFAGFDSDYTDIIARWVASIRSEFENLLVWWENLERRLDSQDLKVSRLHWPAGPASHPRMIALFRQHYFLVHELNVRRSLDEIDEEPAESDWGVDDKDDERTGPISPQMLLIEMMESYAPDLWEYFRLFVYIPIGEDQDLEIC